MKRKVNLSCVSCQKFPLNRDEVGASRKLIGMDTEQFYCIDCLAAYLEVTSEDIEDKIQMYKEDGCTLFN